MDSIAEKAIASKLEVKSERMQIIDRLDREAQYNPNLKYSTTNHFIVVYRGGEDVYKGFGGFLDTHPSSLAEFLESKSGEVAKHLQIDLPDAFQVVEVKKGGVLTIGDSGLHFHNRTRTFSSKEWENARFSWVRPGQAKESSLPGIYGTAAHEAIGHGQVSEVIFPNPLHTEKNDFLAEGLANYCSDIALGTDSHQRFVGEMLKAAERQFVDFRGKWSLDSQSPEQIGKKVQKRSMGTFVPINSAFRLYDPQKSTGIEQNKFLGPKDEYYYQGASFIKFVMDKFGPNVLKDWLRDATKDNFYSSLEGLTGTSFNEMQREWREIVLKSFDSYNKANAKKDAWDRRLNDQEWEEELKKRQQVKALYEKYSY